MSWIGIGATLLAFVLGYTLSMMYITVFYHRGFTHNAVELKPSVPAPARRRSRSLPVTTSVTSRSSMSAAGTGLLSANGPQMLGHVEGGQSKAATSA